MLSRSTALFDSAFRGSHMWWSVFCTFAASSQENSAPTKVGIEIVYIDNL